MAIWVRYTIRLTCAKFICICTKAHAQTHTHSHNTTRTKPHTHELNSVHLLLAVGHISSTWMGQRSYDTDWKMYMYIDTRSHAHTQAHMCVCVSSGNATIDTN